MRFAAVLCLCLCSFGSALSQWSQTSLDSLFITALYADDQVLLAGTQYDGVFRSTDNGATWMQDNTGLKESTVVYCFGRSGSNILVGKGWQVYRTTSAAPGWTNSSTGIVDTFQVYAFGPGPGGYYMSAAGGFYQSGTNGASWTRQGTDNGISCINTIGGNFLAGTNGGSTLRSTDAGVSWSPFGSGASTMTTYGLTVKGDSAYLSTIDGVFLSTNAGLNWSPMNGGLSSLVVRSVLFSGSNAFAGTGTGVFRSSPGTSTWTDVGDGLFSQFVFSLAVDDAYLYVGSVAGVWRRALSEVVTGVASYDDPRPTSSELLDAYPNPFNPSTTISFRLEQSGHAQLTIIDQLGREVARLVDGILDAGTYRQIWQAGVHPSGVYLCRMTITGRTETRKLVLIK